VSFRVVFQCKRYDGSVTSGEVSEFRGSIPSNADKGLLITTGSFTSDAKKRAQEPGLLPVELINGEQLIKIMEKMKLGLKATYEVNHEFFDDFETQKTKELFPDEAPQPA
jgi:restriction system protein